eukprot:s976_g5.t1
MKRRSMEVDSRMDAAVLETKEALEELRRRWEAQPLAEAIAGLDSHELSAEGYRWSQSVSLHYVTPSKAAGSCKALSRNEMRDGLKAPSASLSMPATHEALCIAPAPPCGYGLFAMRPLKQGLRLGEYTGEARRYDLWCEEIKARKVALRGKDDASPFIVEELYAAWAGIGSGEGVVIDAFAKGNAMRCLASQCVAVNVGAAFEKHGRLLVVTARDIEKHEQLSVDYGWYFDPATLVEVRSEATKAYNEDLKNLQVLPKMPSDASPSAASRLLAEAIEDLRNGAPVPKRDHFLHRFVKAEKLLRFVDSGGKFSKAESYLDIPDPVWFLYEVIGAERVGISCRCALDQSLNSTGLCSGIIGRPLQSKHLGRGDSET